MFLLVLPFQVAFLMPNLFHLLLLVLLHLHLTRFDFILFLVIEGQKISKKHFILISFPHNLFNCFLFIDWQFIITHMLEVFFYIVDLGFYNIVHIILIS